MKEERNVYLNHLNPRLLNKVRLLDMWLEQLVYG